MLLLIISTLDKTIMNLTDLAQSIKSFNLQSYLTREMYFRDMNYVKSLAELYYHYNQNYFRDLNDYVFKNHITLSMPFVKNTHNLVQLDENFFEMTNDFPIHILHEIKAKTLKWLNTSLVAESYEISNLLNDYIENKYIADNQKVFIDETALKNLLAKSGAVHLKKMVQDFPELIHSIYSPQKMLFFVKTNQSYCLNYGFVNRWKKSLEKLNEDTHLFNDDANFLKDFIEMSEKEKSCRNKSHSDVDEAYMTFSQEPLNKTNLMNEIVFAEMLQKWTIKNAINQFLAKNSKMDIDIFQPLELNIAVIMEGKEIKKLEIESNLNINGFEEAIEKHLTNKSSGFIFTQYIQSYLNVLKPDLQRASSNTEVRLLSKYFTNEVVNKSTRTGEKHHLFEYYDRDGLYIDYDAELNNKQAPYGNEMIIDPSFYAEKLARTSNDFVLTQEILEDMDEEEYQEYLQSRQDTRTNAEKLADVIQAEEYKRLDNIIIKCEKMLAGEETLYFSNLNNIKLLHAYILFKYAKLNIANPFMNFMNNSDLHYEITMDKEPNLDTRIQNNVEYIKNEFFESVNRNNFLLTDEELVLMNLGYAISRIYEYVEYDTTNQNLTNKEFVSKFMKTLYQSNKVLYRQNNDYKVQAGIAEYILKNQFSNYNIGTLTNKLFENASLNNINNQNDDETDSLFDDIDLNDIN